MQTRFDYNNSQIARIHKTIKLIKTENVRTQLILFFGLVFSLLGYNYLHNVCIIFNEIILHPY